MERRQKYEGSARGGLVLLCLAMILLAGQSALLAGERPSVHIAAIFARSGPAEPYGTAAWKGAEVALAEINRLGGINGRPLVLTYYDSCSTPIKARQAAERAVTSGAIGVVGDIWSTHSMAIAPVMQQAGIPMISPGSTAPALTRIGSYIFRVCYTDDFQGSLMAGFALSLHCNKAAVLRNYSETYSNTLADYFSQAFKKAGGTILLDSGYKGNAVDFGDMIRTLIPLSPQVVFIPGYSRDSGLLIRQARSMGLQPVFLGADAWTTSIVDFAGTAALEGSYFSTHWHPGTPQARSRHFLEQFHLLYHDKTIMTVVPLTYDAVWLLADALTRSGGDEPAALRDALARTRGFEGATGSITFDGNGDPLKKEVSILTFSKGAWHYYRSFTPE